MLKQATPETIAEAAQLLAVGGLVAFPTETVYGLGADATNGKAVARIYEAKGRPSFNPLIVHVPHVADLAPLVEVNAWALELATHFWPGPLTMVLPAKAGNGICDLVSAGLPTLAVRVPNHPVAQTLLKAVAKPIAAPSANVSGKLSPTTPQHVAHSLGDKPDMIVAGGATQVGLESTVIDLSNATPTILRAGAITQEMLERALNCSVPYAQTEDSKAPKAPGMLLAHYAPGIPVRLNAVDVEEGEALLAFGSTKFMAVRGKSGVDKLDTDAVRNLSPTSDLAEAASKLFLYMHELDKPQHKAIAVMPIPNNGIGAAINDRLKRAAAAQV